MTTGLQTAPYTLTGLKIL